MNYDWWSTNRNELRIYDQHMMKRDALQPIIYDMWWTTTDNRLWISIATQWNAMKFDRYSMKRDELRPPLDDTRWLSIATQRHAMNCDHRSMKRDEFATRWNAMNCDHRSKKRDELRPPLPRSALDETRWIDRYSMKFDRLLDETRWAMIDTR